MSSSVRVVGVQVGSKLTTSVDTFSFGIMMWELYTGQRAYGGLGRDAIIDRVYKKKARPIFPLGVPQPYATLAKACWDNDPSARWVRVLAFRLEVMLSLRSFLRVHAMGLPLFLYLSAAE